MLRLGVVGFGARAEGMLKNMVDFEMGVTIAGIYDKDPKEALKKIENDGFPVQDTVVYDSVKEMMEKANLDGVCVSTNCNTHTDFMCEVMKYKIPVLLEKPVSINQEQLEKLKEAEQKYQTPVLVSFPLRYSTLCQLAKEIIDRGDLGKISHVEAINNVSYGRVYFQSWYRDESITGGLFLQKATHDLDYINYLLGEKPVQIAAMESKRIYGGTEPAGKVCSKCEKERTCPESPYNLKNKFSDKEIFGEGCCFAEDTGNHDSASILVKYENGMHASYTQDFIARRSAARRGAIVVGYDATLEFDWVTGKLFVYDHWKNRTITHEVKNNQLFHYGGDKALCENFVGMMRGEQESISPLCAGILSAQMCLLAEKSAKTDRFYQI